MLDKPDIPDEKIAASVQYDYGLAADTITFLPLGADMNTAVYRIETHDQTPYLFKLRSGDFPPGSVTIPNYLYEQELNQIIPPLPTIDGRLWTTLDQYTVILYPFIEGKNGYEVEMTDEQWLTFGTAMHRFHTTNFPASLTRTVRHETYSSQWRDMVRHYLGHSKGRSFEDPLSAELAAYLKDKQGIIQKLINHAEKQLQTIQSQPPPFIVCHADIHAGNVHITPDGTLYIIDWDTLIMAPKERDLMSIGADLMGGWRKPKEEVRLYYGGYGETELNTAALTYYRSERVIEDIALECHLIFTQEGSLEWRERAFYYLKSNFRPNSTIELALQ
jgi:spectinomycin phosphotransferase